MALWPFVAALKKLKGRNEIDRVIYSKYIRRLKNLDERVGRTFAQHGPSESLFAVKESIPTSRKIKGLKASVEHNGYSALAPVTKASKAATPFLAGMYVSDKLSKHEKTAGDTMKTRELMKQAADTIEVHRQRDDQIKIAMLMVERGKCEPFSSMSELEEKIASFEGKSLDVIREALDMDTDLADFGKVASNDVVIAGSDRAEMNFFHRLSE